MTALAIADAARSLAAARRANVATVLAPASLPGDTESAYAIQSALIGMLGTPTVGWKVGATSKAVQDMLGTGEPFSGRLLAGYYATSPADLERTPAVFHGIEAEYVFVLGAIDGPGPLSAETVLRRVTAVRPGIEICDARWRDWRHAGVAALIADNAVTGWAVEGPAATEWQRTSLRDRRVTLSCDGVEVGRGSGRDVLGDPVVSLCWCVNSLLGRGVSIPDGTRIFSGSCTGMHIADGGGVYAADFGPLGRVRVTL